MKNWTIGAISGGLAGIAGAWFVSEYDWSLISVMALGAVIGFVVGLIYKLIKKKRK